MLFSTITKQFAHPQGVIGRIVTRLMNIGNQSLYKSVVDAFPQNKEDRILDIGYGNGYLIQKLIKRQYPNVYGLEISESMQTQLKSKVGKHCTLSLGDVACMPYEAETFDFIYTINTLYFWESLDKGLQEIRRVSKCDATVVLCFYEKAFLERKPYIKEPFILYDSITIQHALMNNGFLLKQAIHKKGDMAISYICKIVKE